MRPSQQEIPKWSHYSRLAAADDDDEEEEAGSYGSQHSLEGAAAEEDGGAAAAAAVLNRTATKGEDSPLILRDEGDGCGGGEKNQSSSVARKVGVAVSGAALTGLGLVMIPLPTPFGCVVAASGMAVLGTEFPAAQKVLDQTLDATVDALERNCDDDGEGQEAGERQQLQEGGVANDDEPITCQQEECATSKIRSASNAATAKLKQSAKMLGRKAIPILRKLGSKVKDDDDKEV